jgi:cytoplasmic iron level regulating protein YaaA (DUF328/UPF0246 family)
MIIVLSPAKSLDYRTPPTLCEHSQPLFLDQAQLLIEDLRQLSPPQLASLMKISDQLAALNFARYADWAQPFTSGKAKQAVLAFNGDVYDGLDAPTLSPADLQFAQRHLRILSGLYGLLRPLDLMQPYRLEMGTRFDTGRGASLYAFWGARLARALEAELDGHRHRVLVNLASDEYFKAVDRSALSVPIVQPVFQEWKGGQWKVISFFAKRARGLMTRHVIDRKIDDPRKLCAFDAEGYAFDASASNASTWYFRRRA